MAETTTELTSEERVFEFDERQIPVSKLKLDELNYRHDEVDNQIAAIRAVIEHQGEKLIKLAAHILENGITPGERIQVVADDQSGDEDAFVVTEGNRRITVFKLLDNPDLAIGTVVHEPFKKMARDFGIRPVRKLPCVVLQGREYADVWMDVKHSANMGGAGIEKWDAVGMSNREARKGRTRRWWATLKYLEDYGEDVADLREGLKKKTTAADRVLGTGIIKDELGVTFSRDGAISFANGDTAAGARLLKAMMAAMSASTFNTNDVHAFGAREAWIRQFAAMAVATTGGQPSPAPREEPKPAGEYPVREDAPKPDTPRGDGWRPDQAEGETAGKNDPPAGPEAPSGRRTKSAKPRKTLAPKGRHKSLFIVDARLNQIYVEATRTKVEAQPAMGAVIIRVFLELACEHYLVEKNVPHPGSKKWNKIGVRLKEKVEATLKSLDPKSSLDELKDVRRGVGGDDHIHSPSRLHDYVHGRETIPVASELPKIWDRYHPLFIKIFDALR